jgi:hypothetical protein
MTIPANNYLKLELGPDVNLWVRVEDLANVSSTTHAVVSAIVSDQINFYDSTTHTDR